ncbi:Zn-dependent protease with chaperone function [Neolewinella xylanilytica]|uniref:Zn-dependent protease with chaperone function n=1 Tax=Neolewinella xylanilytica TaxID=1514080 RepID=A0A2S6IBA4_9BACT|nr:M48 family metallopeptidase [Neolewinella xylanilytica]PPK88739.1 Zn-dependent protease with chaperone function [Neolewinella xylanilytica]
MPVSDVRVSTAFRNQAGRAIFAIILFVVSYLLMLIAAAVLCGACLYAGITLFVSQPQAGTALIGAGIGSAGVLVLIFMIKFLVHRDTEAPPPRIQLHERDQPELFTLIRKVVAEVGTDFPKRVYLSNEVNASVFYDSPFRSMFLPVPKNLSVGMGMLVCTTRQELLAVLAHEFGHFSQRSMRVGSYAYHANRVIHNLLFDNYGYDQMVARWSSASGIFSLFAVPAMLIVRGIQWLLAKVYVLLNRSYLALSREMEFHADEVAAHVAGQRYLGDALLRFDLAQEAYHRVIDHYNHRIGECVTSRNLFTELQYTLHQIARRREIPFRHALPFPTEDTAQRAFTTRVVIKNAWASHPDHQDRVERLAATGLTGEAPDHSAALDVLRGAESLQCQLTELTFAGVRYERDPRQADRQEFIERMTYQLSQGELPDCYGGYYDRYHPLLEPRDFEELPPAALSGAPFPPAEIAEMLDLSITSADAAAIREIARGNVETRFFLYDGQRYPASEARALALRLERECEARLTERLDRDRQLFQHFCHLATERGEHLHLRQYYRDLHAFNERYAGLQRNTVALREGLDFLNTPTDADRAALAFQNLRPLEKQLEDSLLFYIGHPLLVPDILPTTRRDIEQFCAGERTYLQVDEFDIPALEQLVAMIEWADTAREKLFFLLKRALLVYQATLLTGHPGSGEGGAAQAVRNPASTGKS